MHLKSASDCIQKFNKALGVQFAYLLASFLPTVHLDPTQGKYSAYQNGLPNRLRHDAPNLQTPGMPHPVALQ